MQKWRLSRQRLARLAFFYKLTFEHSIRGWYLPILARHLPCTLKCMMASNGQ